MKKIFYIIIITMCIAFLSNNIYGSFLDDAIQKGKEFKNMATSTSLGDSISDKLYDDVLPALGAVGNTIIGASVVLLGLRYIFSSAEGKSVIKSTLPTLIIGIIFFYLGYGIVEFLIIGKGSTKGLFETIFAGNTYASVSANILSIIATIVNFFSVVGIVVFGVRYMFAASDGRADLKESLTSILLGLFLAFCAGNFVRLIISISTPIVNI